MHKDIESKFQVAIGPEGSDYVPVAELDVNKQYKVDETFIRQHPDFDNIVVVTYFVREI
jgi:hypothetical protein